jgi:hypothetical protein
MADRRQELYDELLRRGVFQGNERMQALGHELRARGVVKDPTQGGLVAPTPEPAPKAAALSFPQGVHVAPGVDLANLQPEAAQGFQNALSEAKALGIPLSATVTSGVRSSAKQAQLYAAYQAGKSKYPAAPPGRSLHEQGRAIDLDTTTEYRPYLTAVMERHGFKWLGDRDPVHYSFVGTPIPPHTPQKALPAPPTAPAALPAGSPREAAAPPRFDYAAADPLGAIAAYGQARGPGAIADVVNTGGNAVRAFLSQLGTEVHGLFQGHPEVTAPSRFDYGAADPAAALFAAGQHPQPLAQAFTRAGAAASQALQAPMQTTGQAPTPMVGSRGLQNALGVGKTTTPFVKYPAAIADFLVGVTTDPANALFDAPLRAAGEALAPAIGAAVRAISDKTAAAVGVKSTRRALGELWALADTGRFAATAPNKANLAAGDLQRLQGLAARQGVPLADVASTGNGILARANAAIATAKAAGADPFAGVAPADLVAARRAFVARFLASDRPATAKAIGAAGGAAARAIDYGFGTGATAKLTGGVKTLAAAAGLGPDAQAATQTVRRVLNNTWGLAPVVRGIGKAKRALINNPATQAANLVGNHLMSRLALGNSGLDPNLLEGSLLDALPEVRAYLKKGTLSPDIAELSQASNAFTSTFATLGAAPPAPASKALAAAGRVVNFFGDRQQAAEQLYKLGLYKAAKKAGLDPAAAAALVDRYLFDYSDRSALVEVAERLGLAPFVTYPVKAAKVLFETLATRPDLVARYPRVRSWLYANPTDRAAYEQLPDYQKGPFTIPLGDGEFLSLDRFNPMAGPIETLTALYRTAREGLPLRKTARDLATRALPAAAILNLGFNQQTLAENPDQPRRISNPGEPEASRIPVHLRELMKSYAPSLLGGRGYQGTLEALRGQAPGDYDLQQARSVPEVLLQYGAGLRGAEARPPKALQEQAMAPTLARRKAAAGAYFKQVRDALLAHPEQNPANDEVRALTREEARTQALLAERALEDLFTSGRVVNDAGTVTPEGKQRIDAATRRWFALKRQATVGPTR